MDKNVSFYFLSDPSAFEIARQQGWTPVFLNASVIPMDMRGPLQDPEFGWTESDLRNIQGKYVKILSHMIPELASCQLVLYLDSKVLQTREQAANAFAQVKHLARSLPSGLCVLFMYMNKHYWEGELKDSYLQERYVRFRPLHQKMADLHRANNESFHHPLFWGAYHVTNLSNPEAIDFQKRWWNETISYTIQDQLAMFWHTPRIEHCYAFRDENFKPTDSG